MKIGTKSVLYGGHAFFLHPWFVVWGWWKLYGFPWDPRLWIAFFIHDLGYWGKPNMDGEEGENHPWFAASLMGTVFGDEWGELCLYHSRFFSKKHGVRPSKLCFADKMAIALTPAWIFVPMARATGEIREYRELASRGRYDSSQQKADDWAWHKSVQKYCREYVEEHKDGSEDTWTPGGGREAQDDLGVWK